MRAGVRRGGYDSFSTCRLSIAFFTASVSQRFDAQKPAELHVLIDESVPKHTKKKANWGYGVFEKWTTWKRDLLIDGVQC